MVKRCMDELEHRPEALPAAARSRRRSRAPRTSSPTRPTTREAAGLVLRGGGRRRLRALRAAHGRGERDGLRRPARPHRQPARAVRRRAREVPPDLPLRARRRVPGHQPGAVPDAAAARRGAPQSDRGRRRLSVGLRVPRTPTSATSSTSSATSPTPTMVKLEQNYRSTQTILDAANGLIAHNPSGRRQAPVDRRGRGREGRRSPSSTTSTRRPAGSPPRSTAWSRRGRRRDEIAVFYRMNAQSRVLEDTLVRFDIPYQVIGGTKFYERAEIKDAIAYLQLLANPADAISLAPDRQLAATRDRPADRGAAALAREHDRRRHLGGVRQPEAVPGARRRRGEGGRPLRRDDGGPAPARRDARAGRRAARGGAARVAATSRRSRPSARSRPRAGSRTSRSWSASPASSTPTASSRASQELPPLEEFLAQISLVTEQDDLNEDESLATLMTLHNAKGLEYEAVFMIGCEDGVFPHSRSIDEGNLEEERRLCYVGVTRARERLWPDLRAPALPARRLELEPALALPRRAPRASWSSATSRHRDRLVARRGDARSRATGFGERPVGRGLRGAGAQAARRRRWCLRGRRRRRPRHLRRGRGDRGRAGQGGRRPLRRRRRGAQADGRLRADSRRSRERPR